MYVNMLLQAKLVKIISPNDVTTTQLMASRSLPKVLLFMNDNVEIVKLTFIPIQKN